MPGHAIVVVRELKSSLWIRQEERSLIFAPNRLFAGHWVIGRRLSTPPDGYHALAWLASALRNPAAAGALAADERWQLAGSPDKRSAVLRLRCVGARQALPRCTARPSARHFDALSPGLGSRIWGVETGFRARKRMSSFSRLQWGVYTHRAFSVKTKHPVLTRPISNPQKPIFHPQILEPRPWRPPDREAATARCLRLCRRRRRARVRCPAVSAAVSARVRLGHRAVGGPRRQRWGLAERSPRPICHGGYVRLHGAWPGTAAPARAGDGRGAGPSKPSSLLRFLPNFQYLLEPASGVWLLGCGVLTCREA